MDSIIETCPGCARRLRVPTLRGPLALTCPACRMSWDWSPPESLTQFEPDPARLEPFKPFTTLGASFANHAASGEEWIRQVLSLKTVVYGSGRIAREGDVVRHDVAPAELALCRRLADEARDRLHGKVDGGLGTEGHMPVHAFSIAANRDDPRPARIDEGLIRERFGGTIYPQAAIDVQPLSEDAKWWSQVRMCARESAYGKDRTREIDAFLDVWRNLLRWFHDQPEFVDAAYVAIGDFDRIDALVIKRRKDESGMKFTPSVYPRLFLGLTRNGSLAGVVTHVVQT